MFDPDAFDSFLPADERGARLAATYAVGDVQGCFDDLLRLLDEVDFDPAIDTLWFTGDLVNRGPNSLELLRFVKGLGRSAVVVLGNHDLFLLAAAAGAVEVRRKDTIADVLEAPDREELLFWLRHQALLHHDEELGYTMVHAGLPPQWSLRQAAERAAELESVLRDDDYAELFRHLNGDKPLVWSERLRGWERLRYIANSFTELRWCDRDGRLDLKGVRTRASGRKQSLPWFEVPKRASRGLNVVFGHWAALDAKAVRGRGVYPLDTGCANGGWFTALRLEDRRLFQVHCLNESVPWAGR